MTDGTDDGTDGGTNGEITIPGDPLVALEVVRDGPVAEVTLVGPGRGNLLGPDLWTELPRVFRALDRDESVRAVVFTGSGGNFSYGLDLVAFGQRWQGLFSGEPGLAGPRTRLHDEIRAMQDAVTTVADCRKPVAAAVSGWCVGGGVDLIAACDVRYASAEAMFSLREVRMAIVADLGSLHRLPAIIGDGHFRELALTGKDVDAAWAARIGLVNRVLDDPREALATAREFAHEVAANPPLTVQGVKRVLDAERASRVQNGLKHVAAWNAAFMSSEDLVEAVTAFAQRRSPEFNGG
ncbi:crotonase/enoyl-CoA hydratase family protein [Kineosporia sp. J2-2]|uniref:Crotonase/enoyl-CoA hydratase family protein n=1 Tax=Kineosporia corallincola TaxID=2835133 RepID=A0ABS5TE38_9ACTN|nr:crotonase/enoyl-CoA hydratase family protein [Kineosporia corallincola]MBT0769315.1 crotonase/enoyl-CoA hydratase family protein [Kineosporia corallincola]